MKKTIIISSICCFFCFCSSDKNPQKYHEILEKKWHTDSIITFKYSNLDTAKKHKIDLKIRHTTEYKYQNIYLFVHYLNKEKLVRKDTIQILLAEKNGKWIGKGVGGIREVKHSIKKTITPNSEMKIKLEQAVRYGGEDKLEVLEEIYAIGLKIYSL